MSKPAVFNYNDYIKMKEENQQLQEKIAQLQIRCRIAEEDLRQSQEDLLRMRGHEGTGVYIPGITVEMFQDATLETVEVLLAEGNMINIDLKAQGRQEGEWIDMEGTPTKAEHSMFCSECGRWSEYRTNYCGFCGADMGGKENKC